MEEIEVLTNKIDELIAKKYKVDKDTPSFSEALKKFQTLERGAQKKSVGK